MFCVLQFFSHTRSSSSKKEKEIDTFKKKSKSATEKLSGVTNRLRETEQKLIEANQIVSRNIIQQALRHSASEFQRMGDMMDKATRTTMPTKDELLLSRTILADHMNELCQ